MRSMKAQRSINEQSIVYIKNKVLDNIVLATLPLGMVASFFALNRDFFLGFEYTTEFALINFFSVGLVLILYVFRKKIALELRIIILAALFFFAGIRGLVEIGSISNPYILISISFLILQLLVHRKWMIIMIFLAICLIIIINIASTFNPLFPSINYNDLMRSGQQWAADISLFTLLVVILILSSSNYNSEILNVINIVRSKNHELNENNQLLKKEMSARERYEKEVMINSQKFQTLFESSTDGIILTDENLKIIETNPSFCDITDYTREELIGNNILDILAPKNKDLILNRYYRIMKGEIQPLTEISIQTKTGYKKVIEFNSNLIIGVKDQLTIITTIRNITGRKEIEEQKFNAVLEAEENERERFSKDLHDELGPLFSTVKLYVESLKSKESNPEREKVFDKLTEIVNNGVAQIREISHNLSPHLLREKGLLRAIETHLKWVKDSSSLEIDYSFTDNIESNSKLGNIEILVYRVFLELMNNSLKHSGATKVSLSVTIDKDYINFVFSDNGVGFDPNAIKQQSAGIGLKNIMNRIHAINGEIVFSFDKWMKTDIKLPL